MSYLDATADLLRVARTSLRDKLMPTLSSEQRYEAAMIANVIAIAVREVELGPRTRAAERELLAGFLDDAETDLTGLRRRLCAAIREGRIEESREAALRQLLHARTRALLAISNPGYAEPGT